MDNNCDSDARAGVGISMRVEDAEGLGNGLMERGFGELCSPPGKIIDKVADRVMWHERTRTGDTEH